MNKVIQDTRNHISQCGGSYSDWYAGVAADARDRLFSGHSVKEKGDSWIFRDCGTDTAARQVEEYFLNLGCKGGPSGGDSNSRFFYAYRIASHTRE